MLFYHFNEVEVVKDSKSRRNQLTVNHEPFIINHYLFVLFIIFSFYITNSFFLT